MTTDLQRVYDELYETASNGDTEGLHRLVVAGADPNMRDASGDPILPGLMLDLQDDRSLRYAVTRELLALGANPNQLDSDDSSALLYAIYSSDIPLLGLLLAKGADPNFGCSEPYESIYDAAEFDYHATIYHGSDDLRRKLREDDEQRASGTLRDKENRYLDLLDADALRHEAPRPEAMRLLRAHGALTSAEIAESLGVPSPLGIVWRDGAWRPAA